MKVGVIGIGTMGKNHVRVYSELKKVDDIYVYDSDSLALEKLNDVIICESTQELLREVDAVSICVPTSHHFSVVKEAIEADVHVLVEKPITLRVEEGEKLLEMYKGKDIIFGVGHIERFNPIVGEITNILNEPAYVEMKRHNPASSRILDSSVIEDLMIHDIDIIFNLFFPNRDFKLRCAGNASVASVLLKFGNSTVFLSASRIAAKKIRNIYVEEETITIEGNFMTQEVFVYRRPEKYGLEGQRYIQENIIEKVLVNKVEPLKVELNTFIDCVDKGKSFPVTPEQALSNLKICEAIKRELNIL